MADIHCHACGGTIDVDPDDDGKPPDLCWRCEQEYDDYLRDEAIWIRAIEDGREDCR